MYILGISCYYHDSAACLTKDDVILAAAQEERFTRIKNDSTFPKHAIEFCLKTEGLDLSQVDQVVFFEKPLIKFDRILETIMGFAPRGFSNFRLAIGVWFREKLFQNRIILRELSKISGKSFPQKKLSFSSHHLSHAASAFYPSPFVRAAVLTMDGVGEWATTSIFIGDQDKLTPVKQINFPHSLGLLYSAFTQYLGFKVNSAEYKVMGLAPYGRPIYKKLIEDNFIRFYGDGSYGLNMELFGFCTEKQMINTKFSEIFGVTPRHDEDPLSQFHMDVASSLQAVTEEAVIRVCKHVKEITGERNLCLSGGVALNCVANGILSRLKIFDSIWVQPAAGDAGSAIGAALAYFHLDKKGLRTELDGMRGAYLGPSYSSEEVRIALIDINANFIQLSQQSELLRRVALEIADGKVVGWFQGRMEFGPRALGNRSILADPRSPSMQKQLNLKIKFRESFRPFAPSIIFEELKNWFEATDPSPYMQFVSLVNKDRRIESPQKGKLFGIDELNKARSVVPAVTHIDYSARVQTVHKETNPKFWALLKEFKDLTGVPLLINTSFNVRGEPIVCNPKDAYRCFMGTDMDVLVLEDFILFKNDQPTKNNIQNFKEKFDLD